MLNATADWQGTVEVRKKDELLATLQRTGRFQAGGKDYVIARHAITWPKFTLNHDDIILAEAERTSILSFDYGVRHNDQTWTMKLESLFQLEAGLYSDEGARIGSLVSKSFFSPASEVAMNLPYDIALEAQVFVLWIFLQLLHGRSP